MQKINTTIDHPINFADVFTWTSLGWYVAAFLGIWGVLMGTGDYTLAEVSFVVSVLIATVKWAHVTRLLKTTRNLMAFFGGFLVFGALTYAAIVFAQHKRQQAKAEDTKLAQLNLLPRLQSEVATLPELKTQVSQIPLLNQKIEASNAQAVAANLVLTQFLQAQGANIQQLGMEALNNITGGDSWGWTMPWPSSDGSLGFSLINEGKKYPLHNVRIFVSSSLSPSAAGAYLETFQCDPVDVPPHTGFDITSRCSIHPDPTRSNSYLITVGANNGSVSERLTVSRKENKWTWTERVFRTLPNGQEITLKTL